MLILGFMQAELGTEKKAKFKLAEMCEQLQVQVCKINVLYPPYYH